MAKTLKVGFQKDSNAWEKVECFLSLKKKKNENNELAQNINPKQVSYPQTRVFNFSKSSKIRWKKVVRNFHGNSIEQWQGSHILTFNGEIRQKVKSLI